HARRLRSFPTRRSSDLEDGLHALFRFFESGISSTELNISPLGGVLFGVDAAPLVDALAWGEHGCAVLLDKLLRAPRGKGRARTLDRKSTRLNSSHVKIS